MVLVQKKDRTTKLLEIPTGTKWLQISWVCVEESHSVSQSNQKQALLTIHSCIAYKQNDIMGINAIFFPITVVGGTPTTKNH
jgi:hypothetical protein